MEDESAKKRRIAKNTILLYVRMLFLMLISLYTSRVILAALGIEDYGIYNIVGGVVTVFTLISGSLQAAVVRFITYELGKGDTDKLRVVFSSCIIIQWIIAIVFIVLAETIGLWFVNEKLVIPVERMLAANWVYQLSILTFFINLISVPYNATIIAHEKMSVYAYISIFEGVSKLFVALLILYSPIDKLIFYAILLSLIAVIVRIVYGAYCKRHFDECVFSFKYNKEVFNQIFSFAGWNVIGATSAVCRDQGGNILINLFSGPSVNAARGVAIQVSNAIQGFVNSFQTALNPQITKSYASGESCFMFKLISDGARYSYYILFFIALPLLLNTDYILSIWLKEVPEHTNTFMRLVIILTLIESLSGPLITAMYATGKVKRYQIVVGGLQMLNLPFSYVALKLGFPPESVFVVANFLAVACLIARVIMLKPLLNLPVKKYVTEVWGNVVAISILSGIVPFLYNYWVKVENFGLFVLSVAVSVICSFLVIVFIGCNKEERIVVSSKIQQIIKH